VFAHTLYAIFIISIAVFVLPIAGMQIASAQETDRFDRLDSDRDASDRSDRGDRGDREDHGMIEVSRERVIGPFRDFSADICARLIQVNERLQVEIPLPLFCNDEEEPPEQDMGHIVISEVYYDVDGEHGSEGANEWVELYNPTGVPVNIGGWSIGDSASGALLPGEIVIPAGGVVLLTQGEGLEILWPEISESVEIIVLGSPINTGGLSNSGDALFLRNPSADLVDSVSWGTNTDAFDPSVLGVGNGESIERVNPDIDTDTSVDWTSNSNPTPGVPGALQQS